MKRKSRLIIFICILSCLILSGCKDADTKTSDRDSSKNDKETVEEEKSNDEKSSKKEKTKKKEKKKADRSKLFQEILYEYKEAQDGEYSADQVSAMGLWTELVQYGWPGSETGDEVRYLYYDIDSDGNDELIITYYDDIIDIYGWDGDKVRMSYSTPYRGITALFDGGMIRMDFSISAGDSRTTWYQYDTELGDCFPVLESLNDYEGEEKFYSFCFYEISEEMHEEVVEAYRNNGDYPDWVCEWAEELTKKEYDSIIPNTDPVELPEGEPLSSIELPDDYEPKMPSGATEEAVVDDEDKDDEDQAVPGFDEPETSKPDPEESFSKALGEPMEITRSEQKKLNLFLSNFAEQGFGPFDREHPDVGQITEFAYIWSRINKPDDVKIDGDNYVLAFGKIKKIANTYFGIKLTERELKDHIWNEVGMGVYSDGYFRAPLADGESFTNLAIAKSASDLGEGRLRIEFDIYSLDLGVYFDNSGEIPRKYYSMNNEKAEKSEELNHSGEGYAIVYLDDDSYKLSYYETY